MNIFNLGGLTYNVVSTLAGGIVFILAWISGVVISIESWLIGIVMNVNANVMQTSFVQTGFSISLSVANLAFVLGIIVVALATILRLEEYSIKKILWKLVVMAILVNFGLVIMNPIFALANSFTNYFLNCITPSAGGCTQASSGFQGYETFANTMVAKFAPGTVWAAANQISSGQGGANVGGLYAVNNEDYSLVGSAMVPIFSLLFSVVDFVLIVFVLGAFLCMLVIRYIYIAILAILLPFAWAAWVFPEFSGMFHKWWDSFLHWTFFAPISMFFLYLAFATIGGTNNADAFNLSNPTYVDAGNGIMSSLIALLGAQIQPLLAQFLQELVLGGLIIGGLVAADKMGVHFAGSAIKAVQKGAKSVQGYVGKQSKKAGVAVFHKAGGHEVVNRMREGRVPLAGVRGIGWVAKRSASLLGNATEHAMSNKSMVDDEKKHVPDSVEEVKRNLKGNMNTEKVFAHLSKLVEKNALSRDTDINGKKAGEWLDEHGTEITSYGFNKGDADKNLGGDEKMRAAARNVESAREEAYRNGVDRESVDFDPAVKREAQALQEASNAFVEKLNPSKDGNKMNFNDIYSNKNDPSNIALARSFAMKMPTLGVKALSSTKSTAHSNFIDIYGEQLKAMKSVIHTFTSHEQENIELASKTFRKAIEKAVLSGGNNGDEDEDEEKKNEPAPGVSTPANNPAPASAPASGGNDHGH